MVWFTRKVLICTALTYWHMHSCAHTDVSHQRAHSSLTLALYIASAYRMLCAAFALGSASSPNCPESYFLIDTADACKSAAAAANRTYGGTGFRPQWPYGCCWHTALGSVYYNRIPNGVANSYVRPLCAGAAHAHAAVACIAADEMCAKGVRFV
jgi:hypothetical protein